MTLKNQLPHLNGGGQGVNRLMENIMIDLKAPFPWFGGKSRIASLVWDRLGDVGNFIEPFCGSAAVLIARPFAPKIETVNDADCYVSNFWRATQQAPDLVAEHADGPVNEADLHARHRWLVLSEAAGEFRAKMRTEPDYFDAKVAGWWCWGLCCWIGSGWCTDPEAGLSNRTPGGTGEASVAISHTGKGIKGINTNGPPGGSGERSPILGGGEGQYGHGIHAKGLSQQLPEIGGGRDKGASQRGVHAPIKEDNHRLQLADAYSRGRGVHNDNHLSEQYPAYNTDGGGYGVNRGEGTCAQRRAWLLDWFGRLRDRLRTVRVCCGDWLRVCNSESVTTRLGVTGIFFDPPYGHGAGRDQKLYSTDSLTVAADVRRYCLERGSNRQMRIVLAGYVGEGHEELERHGWSVEAWKAHGGYGNRSQKGKDNSAKERLWVSPHCQKPEQPLGIFDLAE